MDFMAKLKHGVSGESARQDPSDPSTDQIGQAPKDPDGVAQHDAEPERDFLEKLIVGTGHSSRHGESAEPKDDKISVLDRLTHKEKREKRAIELVKEEAELRYKLERVAHEKKENESLLERIKGHFDVEQPDKSSDSHDHKHSIEDKPSFLDKITGADARKARAAELDREEDELRAELERVVREKRDNEGILHRLKEHLDGEDGEEKPAHNEKRHSLLDKITGKAAEQDRLHQEEEHKSTLDKMKDRMNEQMGGGPKAEANEDFLDKAIDAFQEHVLRQGDQSNESALEQLKDKKIADAIRGQLHMGDKTNKN